MLTIKLYFEYSSYTLCGLSQGTVKPRRVTKPKVTAVMRSVVQYFMFTVRMRLLMVGRDHTRQELTVVNWWRIIINYSGINGRLNSYALQLVARARGFDI